MSNGVSIEDLLNNESMFGKDVERISFRTIKPTLDIVSYDPSWPSTYEIFAARIVSALGSPSTSTEPSSLISVTHVGSTSVPGLPAKAIIDIDVVVPDPNNESAYVPALESQGFQFMLREKWYSHRFFTATEPMFANLHVWGPRCAETERHRIFKEWLVENEGDRELYAEVKRDASKATTLAGETVIEYTKRKGSVVKDILGRALKRIQMAGINDKERMIL